MNYFNIIDPNFNENTKVIFEVFETNYNVSIEN